MLGLVKRDKRDVVLCMGPAPHDKMRNFRADRLDHCGHGTCGVAKRSPPPPSIIQEDAVYATALCCKPSMDAVALPPVESVIPRSRQLGDVRHRCHTRIHIR